MKGSLVYILSDRRSGSTALDYILSSHPSVHSVGEGRLLDRFYSADPTYSISKGRCTCGALISRCAFWSRTMAKSAERLGIEPGELRSGLRPEEERDTDVRKKVTSHVRELYSAIAASTNSIVLDSSKTVRHLALLLDALPEWDIRVIHLTRDPYQVARSKIRWRERQDLNSRPVAYYLYRWLLNERKARRMLRLGRQLQSMTVTYEEFVSNPEPVLGDLAGFLGVSPNFSLAVQLRDLHTVAGTPTRFDSDVFELAVQPLQNTEAASRAYQWLARVIRPAKPKRHE